jgi:hypothetical protein
VELEALRGIDSEMWQQRDRNIYALAPPPPSSRGVDWAVRHPATERWVH